MWEVHSTSAGSALPARSVMPVGNMTQMSTGGRGGSTRAISSVLPSAERLRAFWITTPALVATRTVSSEIVAGSIGSDHSTTTGAETNPLCVRATTSGGVRSVRSTVTRRAALTITCSPTGALAVSSYVPSSRPAVSHEYLYGRGTLATTSPSTRISTFSGLNPVGVTWTSTVPAVVTGPLGDVITRTGVEGR